MPKENQTYYETLADLKEQGGQLFPGRLSLRQCHVVQLTGQSPATVCRLRKKYGFVDGFTTYPKLARALSREA